MPLAPPWAPTAGCATTRMVPEPARIRRVRHDTADVFTVWLTPPRPDAPFAFQPGQFNMLYLFGVGEVAISISGDPTQQNVIQHTIREVGTVTRAIARLGVGGVLGVRGPFGTPWPVAAVEGQDLLLVAGGLGLAPLRPALLHALHRRDRYGRVIVLYGTRSPADLLFVRELRKLQRLGALEVLTTVDRADPSFRGHVGVVTSLLPQARLDPARTAAFLCGPEIMMRFTVRELERLGVPEERVWVSLERNMKCAVGVCGHCQLGPSFVCKDGPVFRHDAVRDLMRVREL